MCNQFRLRVNFRFMKPKNEKTSEKSIKSRSIMILAGLCTTIIFIVASSFIYVSHSISTINNHGLKFDQLSQKVEQVEDIYRKQAKDRKNLFLRGHKEKDLKKYSKKIFNYTEKINQTLQDIYTHPLSGKYKPELQKFEQKLGKLMVTYTEAIAILKKSKVPFEADQYVRGKGGKVGEELHSVIEKIRLDRQTVNVDGQRKINNFLVSIASLICASLLITTLLFLSFFMKTMNRILGFSNLIANHEKALEGQETDIIQGMEIAHKDVFKKTESELKYHDEISKMFQSFRDLNEIKLNLTKDLKRSAKLEAEVERMKLVRDKNKELAESLDQKNTLLRVIVHDLSNPLFLVMGMVDLAFTHLSNGDLDCDKHMSFWKKVEKASLTQKTIIEDCRKLAAIDSGKINIQLAPVSLNNVIENCLFMLEDRIKEKNLTVDYNKNHMGKLTVFADESALSNQVIANILSNAIKFSRKNGKIEIVAKEQDSLVHLQIRDHGIGIPQKILSKLFDPTAPTSRNGTAGERGTGFGMPVAKAYMESFKGKIEVQSVTPDESEKEAGTTVELSL